MATIVLGAVGASIGASVGGGVLGLSSVVIGRAVGASVGRAIDQRLMGSGSQTVETGRVERFRLTSASEGSPVAQVFGRMRVAGQVIWATRFGEHQQTSGGGKGAPSQPQTVSYSNTVSLAIALCEGEITRVGRIWADGTEIARDELTLRVYTGSRDQMPDPKIEAVEGAGTVPAYRGTAYVVIEDLDLTRFGNRVPQFTFEVLRAAPAELGVTDLTHGVQGVAMIPGTGEYALATTPVYIEDAPGQTRATNVNSPSGKTDFATSLETLTEELPNCGSISLVVSWFGDDLRCGSCSVMPKVEQSTQDAPAMPWSVSGLGRSAASEVVRDGDDRSVYGGTPTDASVVEAIAAMNAEGKSVMFYPFLLMEQMAGNTLTDPWSGAEGQAALPWRGRITTSLAPGIDGSPDGTAAATDEVDAFFGYASPSDFAISGTTVSYSGPAEWSFRRMILHYAHLCVAAGGVSAFCIGSELRGITRVRSDNGWPGVDHLRLLAAELREILGPDCKIGYAADWTEYAGYQRDGDLLFPLDALWADETIDFVGIDNYMPLSDWRNGADHADAEWGSVYDLDYLQSNIEGGEGFDWYYAGPEHRAAQIRTPITDGAYNEPWVWRAKDMRGWWGNAHHERIGGVRAEEPTAWVPGSKPIWLTEIGCPAVDKGTNEPNAFVDVKSSESRLPYGSNGRRDDLIQMQYLRAMIGYWSDPERNPVSGHYDGPMIDVARTHVWAWDARPYPSFPALSQVWGDADNYTRGHWLNGRVSARSLADVVAEICKRAGVEALDLDRLHGLVRGYAVSDISDARAQLQPLMLAYGFEAIERDGQLVFRSRNGLADRVLDPAELAVSSEVDGQISVTRAPEAEMAGRVRLTFVDAEASNDVRAEEAVFAGDNSNLVSQSEFPLALTRTEGRQIVERWLAEARVARDSVKLALPMSQMDLGAGDVIELPDQGRFRIDHMTVAEGGIVDAVRVEPEIWQPSDWVDAPVTARAFVPPVPVLPLMLDLPLLTGDEVAHAPHLAITAQPWPGSVAVYGSSSDSNYTLNRLVSQRAVIGVTETALGAAQAGIWDRGAAVRVRMLNGNLSSAPIIDVLNGANAVAIGDCSGDWEVFQFAEAELVAEQTFEVSMRLRGQQGTDGLTGEWPPGSYVVLLDGRLPQLDLPLSARGLDRHYRIGPATRPLDDPSYLHQVRGFAGVGLRPYAPAHLRARRAASGDLDITWIRRTRVDGDSWQSVEVPLGEAQEQYVLRVVDGAQVLREVMLSQPNWTYDAAMQASDGVSAPYSLHVAQVSDAFGPGLFRRIDIND